MKEVGLLLNYTIQDYSNEDNQLIISLLRKSLEIIDNDINDNNGLAGYKIKTHLIVSQSDSEKNNNYLSYLRENQNIKFIQGNSALKKLLDVKNIIFLQANFASEAEENVFITSRVSNDGKVKQIKYFFSNFKNLRKVYFFHDNKRLKNYENTLKKNTNMKFISFDFSQLTEEDKIIKKVNFFLKKINKQDIIVFDVGNRVTKHFFNFFNENPDKIGLALLAFVTLEGKYKKFNFPLVEIKSNQVISATLALKEILKRTNISFIDKQLELFLTSSFRLDYPLLLKQAADKIKHEPVSYEELLEQMNSSLQLIDGDKDIFIGLRHRLAFINNKNIIKDNYSFIFPESMFDGDSFHKVFYDTQFFPIDNKISKVNINTINFDILRITNVDISNGTWGAEFIMNVTSKYKNPIDFIIFNNLSMVNREYETKLINYEESASSGSYNYEYYIVANFDFHPKPDNYPFDWQHLYIGYRISDKEKYGYIQPVPEQLLDKEFKIEGWKVRNAVTGIKQSKMNKFIEQIKLFLY